jgi:NAD(P)-dependent dehydrogenase (short-subunit alcohol dehydrogenase family)
MKKSLSGKTALITGSTSGIGLGIAKKFAENGANILLNGFGEQKEINELVAKMQKDYKVKVMYSDADVSKPQAIRDMCNKAIATFGGVDILVNNAGIQNVQPIDEFKGFSKDKVKAPPVKIHTSDISKFYGAYNKSLPEVMRDRLQTEEGRPNDFNRRQRQMASDGSYDLQEIDNADEEFEKEEGFEGEELFFGINFTMKKIKEKRVYKYNK